MINFSDFWNLLNPKAIFANRKKACYDLWCSLSEEEKQKVYETILEKLSKGIFVDYNPLFALKNNSSFPPGRAGVGCRQILSYDAYYDRYHTTLETDGWKRVFLEDEHKTIYVKQS